MNVRELIDQLEMYNDEDEVRFAYNWGDHVGHIAAPSVTQVEEHPVSYSEYIQECQIEKPRYREDSDNAKDCVILSCGNVEDISDGWYD